MTTYTKPNVRNRIIVGTAAVALGVPALWLGLSNVGENGNPATPVNTVTNTYDSPRTVHTPSEEGTTSSPRKHLGSKTSKPRTTSTGVYYRSCQDVWNSGDADGLRRGEPGYRPGLDRDHDGTACENRG